MAYSAEQSSWIWLEGLMYRVMWTAMQGPNDEDVKRQVMTARRDCEGEREPERLSLLQCLHLSAWLGRGAEPVHSRAQALSPFGGEDSGCGLTDGAPGNPLALPAS